MAVGSSLPSTSRHARTRHPETQCGLFGRPQSPERAARQRGTGVPNTEEIVKSIRRHGAAKSSGPPESRRTPSEGRHGRRGVHLGHREGRLGSGGRGCGVAEHGLPGIDLGVFSHRGRGRMVFRRARGAATNRPWGRARPGTELNPNGKDFNSRNDKARRCSRRWAVRGGIDTKAGFRPTGPAEPRQPVQRSECERVQRADDEAIEVDGPNTRLRMPPLGKCRSEVVHRASVSGQGRAQRRESRD